MKSSARNNEKATGDKRLPPLSYAYGGRSPYRRAAYVGALGVARALAPSITAMATGEAPVLPLLVPSSGDDTHARG